MSLSTNAVSPFTGNFAVSLKVVGIAFDKSFEFTRRIKSVKFKSRETKSFSFFSI